MFAKDKYHRKDRDQCNYTGKYRGVAYSICNLRFDVPNEILGVFDNSSVHDYGFIIKELVKEFTGEFDLQ